MDNTDIIDDGYDDFDDGYDGGLDSADDVGTHMNNNRTDQDKDDDQMDAILRVLAGEEVPEDEVARINAESNGKPMSSRNLDSSGRPDYSRAGDQDSATSSTSETTRYGYNADQLGSQDIIQGMDAAQAQWDKAHQYSREIDQALRDGDMTEQEAYLAQHYAGQMAGQARTAMLQGEIASRDYQAYKAQAYDTIAKELDLPKGDGEALNAELKATVNWMREQGISEMDLMAVDDPGIVIAAGKARRAIENDAKQRGQIIQQKKQIRALKKRLGIADNKARKSNQIGTRDGTDHQMNQIMDILTEAGAVKDRGRR